MYHVVGDDGEVLCNTKKPDMKVYEDRFVDILVDYPKQCCVRCSREVLRLRASKANESKDCSQLHSSFHRLWTKSVGQLAYDKREWQRFAELLGTFGIDV